MPSATPCAPSRPAAPAPFRAGAVAMAPLVVGYLPFALVVGAATAEHGGALSAWVASWIFYGGSAQLASMRTLGDAGPVVAVVTGLLINTRLLVYSAGLARSWSAQPRWFHLAAAGLVIDPTFALAQRHAADCRDPAQQQRFFLGTALTLGAVWSAGVAAGAAAGPRLQGVDLEIVVPLCLVAVVGAGLRAAASRSVVLVAGPTAVLASSLPAGTGLLVAIGAGVVAGGLWDRWST